MSQSIIVQDYDAAWPMQFAALMQILWPAVSDLVIGIEHVGSTAVPGLPAKPVIDLDLVIASRSNLAPIIGRLQKLGYEHRGNLGIEDRDAFRAPDGSFNHHLYVCLTESTALKNHLRLRDRLRTDAAARMQYGQLKRALADKFPNSIDEYVSGKTRFIVALLQNEGIGPLDLEAIRLANENPPKQ